MSTISAQINFEAPNWSIIWQIIGEENLKLISLAGSTRCLASSDEYVCHQLINTDGPMYFITLVKHANDIYTCIFYLP